MARDEKDALRKGGGSYATHPPQSGSDIRTVQELLRHTNVATAVIITSVMRMGAMAVGSPLDRLLSANGLAFWRTACGRQCEYTAAQGS